MRKQYARIKSWERQAKKEYEGDVRAVMVTLTASNEMPDGSGRYVPPVDFTDDLLEGYAAARHRLSHIFDSSEDYSSIRILEPHKSGYPHVHLGILTDKEVEPRDFEDLVGSHLSNCELAGRDAHKIYSRREQKKRNKKRDMLKKAGRWDPNNPREDCSTGCVSVKINDEEKAGLGSYLGAYLGEELNNDSNVLDSEDYLKRFFSLMWITGRRRFQPSRKATELMNRELDEDEPKEDDTNYELKGIKNGEDGDIIRVDPSKPRTVTRYEIDIPDRNIPPPSNGEPVRASNGPEKRGYYTNDRLPNNSAIYREYMDSSAPSFAIFKKHKENVEP
jgi:hypothetical protein